MKKYIFKQVQNLKRKILSDTFSLITRLILHRRLAPSQQEAMFSLQRGGLFVCLFICQRDYAKQKKAIGWIFTTGMQPNRTVSVLVRIQMAERIQSCLIDAFNTARVSFFIQYTL